jgi:hypothetical protein
MEVYLLTYSPLTLYHLTPGTAVEINELCAPVAHCPPTPAASFPAPSPAAVCRWLYTHRTSTSHTCTLATAGAQLTNHTNPKARPAKAASGFTTPSLSSSSMGKKPCRRFLKQNVCFRKRTALDKEWGFYMLTSTPQSGESAKSTSLCLGFPLQKWAQQQCPIPIQASWKETCVCTAAPRTTPSTQGCLLIVTSSSPVTSRFEDEETETQRGKLCLCHTAHWQQSWAWDLCPWPH